MRLDLPTFSRSSWSPSPEEPGIALSLGPAPGSGIWLHGTLALEGEGWGRQSAESWTRALFVTLVGHQDLDLRVVNLVRDRAHYQDHTLAEPGPGGAELRVLPFSFDVLRLVPGELAPQRYHARISARHYRSEPVTFSLEDAVPDAPDAEAAADLLLQGYALAAAGQAARAAGAFKRALEEETLRADLDRGNLLNGARAACRAALVPRNLQANEWLEIAVGWLAEDLRRRRDLLQQETVQLFNSEVTDRAKPGDSRRLQRLRAELVTHFREVRGADEDLAILQDLPPFEALFVESVR